MLRVSRLTDYGTMILGCLAQAEGRSLSAKKIAAATRLRLPTAQKLLKQLAGRGLVRSERGRPGRLPAGPPGPRDQRGGDT